MTRVSRTAIIFALAALVLLAGCLPSTVSSSPTQATRITVVLGASGGSLNPYSPLLSNRQVGELVFDGLTDISSDGTPVPDLLMEVPTRDNGGLSSDGREVRLRLKPGRVWHDGKAVTADDVAFTLGLLRDGVLTDEPTLRYSNIESVKVVGAQELRVHLTRPDAPFAWRMVPYVLPRHLLEREPKISSASYWFSPIGSGPYRVAMTRPGLMVELEPRAGSTSVPLTVLFTTSTDAARGEYDDASASVWVDGPTETSVSGESVVSTQGVVWRATAFNVGAKSVGADPIVRRAYLSLVPMESTASVPPVDPFGLPLARRSVVTTRSVAGLLRSEGWRMGGDGVLEKSGKPLILTMATRTFLSEDLPRFEAVTSSMGSVGIAFKTYTLDYLDVGGYFERDYLGTDEWQVARTRFYGGMPLGVSWPFVSGSTPSWEDPYGGNVWGVEDTELDRRYKRILDASDPADARAAWKRMGKRLNALGVVFWEYPEPSTMLIKGVTSVEPHSALASVLRSAPTWRLTSRIAE